MSMETQTELTHLSGLICKSFSFIHDISVFIKDIEGRFVDANQAFLRLMEVSSLDEIVGKTDLDFVQAELARAYMHDDRKVMDAGKCLENRIEPLPKGKSSDARIFTTKFPLRSRDGRILGLVGIARNLTDGAKRPFEVTGFSKAISHLEDPASKRYDAAATARIQGMSKSKFEREFKKLFHMSPAAYHLQTRLRLARNDLLYTLIPISQIAEERGFSDQSHFTKRFHDAYGNTPLRYRKKALTPLPLESLITTGRKKPASNPALAEKPNKATKKTPKKSHAKPRRKEL